jgi:NTP pyrophosphatase (non-canonical NTP hydrolase)
MDNNLVENIIAEVLDERDRQDAEYGAPPRDLKPTFFLPILGEEFGEICRAIVEGDSENYREELIQLAATAIAAVLEFDSGLALHNLESVCRAIKYRRELNKESGG